MAFDTHTVVIPAKAGIHISMRSPIIRTVATMDPRLRGDDE